MAIGASRASIAALILTQSVRVILAGMAAGLAVSFVLMRFLSGLLFGLAATDGTTFALVSIFLLVVALAASLIPALSRLGKLCKRWGRFLSHNSCMLNEWR